MRVLVVGGGAVGLCCSLALQRAGAQVTLLERGRCGAGASAGNAGWITPCFSSPVAAPGTVPRALRWMLDPASPFLIRPRADLSFLRWSWRFARACSPERHQAGTAALVRLNERTFELFDRLRASGVEFELHQNGLIFLALSETGLDEYAETLEKVVASGYPGAIEQLDGDAVRTLEPAVGNAVVAAMYARSECRVRPETLTAGLLSAVLGAGADVKEETPVLGLRRAAGEWRVATPGDEFAADRVLVAAGAWTEQLVRPLGDRVPLEGGKGYSITAAVSGQAATHALYFAEAKVACSPFDGGVRLAGTMELAGLDLRLRRPRLDALSAAARRYLQEWTPSEEAAGWCGLRPLAPDGLPVLGELPRSPGVFVATGHGMLGITLAPVTAELLTPMVLGEAAPGSELAPFSPDRFQGGTA
jgi:D-amino-acid dehydrogenase